MGDQITSSATLIIPTADDALRLNRQGVLEHVDSSTPNSLHTRLRLLLVDFAIRNAENAITNIDQALVVRYQDPGGIAAMHLVG